MSQCFTLSPTMLAAAFPFHFVIDQDLQIVQAGDVLQRICPNTLIGTQLDSHFCIQRPKIKTLSYADIHKRKKSLFVLNLLHDEMQFKGQFMKDEDRDILFFLGSPWITSIDSLTPLNIKLKDFAIHDPIVDFVFLLQASQTSLQETKRMAGELSQQQEQLRQTLAVKENLAKIAESQSKRLEEMLKNLKATQAQLIQTEKMSGLGQMVAGVAHEINNPINFIHANLNYVTEYTEDLLETIALYQQNQSCHTAEITDFSNSIDLDFLMKDLPQVVSSMKVGTERIRDIVASLRNFSRLDEAEEKFVDIHSGIDSTLLILQHRLKETEIKVHKVYGELPDIECYAGQLNQVFMNLLSNAIDAMSDCDSPQQREAMHPSSLSIETTVKGPDQIVIKISDNGPGIPQNIQSKLFDPFFTTKSVGKGTGLGLSISYQIIVEKHHGQLWCESSPNGGTSFYVQLARRLPIKPQNKGFTAEISALTK